MRSPSALLWLLAASTSVLAADSSTKTSSTALPACTATSSTGSGGFFDLRPDIAAKEDEGKKNKNGAPGTDYHARGWDYGRNFTLNICGGVVDEVKDVVGVEKSLWRNISAYYIDDDKVFSLGLESMNLTSRGRKLVLQYKGGSPCGAAPSSKSKRGISSGSSSSAVHNGAAYKKYDDDEEEVRPASAADDDDDQKKTGDEDDNKKGKGGDKDKDTSDKDKDKSSGKKKEDTPRKSATISFLCDRDQLSGPAAVSFVDVDPYECAYFFEVRSPHACPAAEPHTPGSVGPGSIFAIIFFIAVAVYFGGGVFYQRTVAHARGWRQLPNYSLWAGIWGFISDMFVIATSSCARFLPRRRGYHYLSSSPTGRGRNREDENRLIDQLDEEWDD